MLFALPLSCVLALLLALQTAPVSDDSKNQARKKAAEAGRLIGKGEWRAALPVAREAVAADPESAETHYVLGLALEAAGELEKAEAEYRKMATLTPPEPLLELSLARLYLKQDRVAEAEQQARRAVEKNRSVPQPHLSLGAVLMRKEEYAAAVTAFKEAVETAPRDFNVRLSLADACRRARQYDDALAHYAEAHSIAPDDPAPHIGRGQTWELTGRHLEAVAAFERALQAARSDAEKERISRMLENAKGKSK